MPETAISSNVAPVGPELSLNVALAESTKAFLDVDPVEDAVWDLTVKCLRGLLGGTVAAWRADRPGSGFDLVSGPGDLSVDPDPLSLWGSLAFTLTPAAATRFDATKPLHMTGSALQQPWDAVREFFDHHDLADGLLVPLRTRSHDFGLLLAARRTAAPGFSLSDEAIARHVGACATLALDRSRLMGQTPGNDRRKGKNPALGSFKLLADAVVATDLDGIVTCWNSRAEQMYGIAESQTLGRRLRDVLPTTPVGNWTMRSIRDQLRRDGRWRGELEQTTPDGRRLRVVVTSTIFEPPDSSEPIVVTIVRDDTELHVALRRQEALSSRTLDALPAATALVDHTGRIEAVNRAWRHHALARGGDDSTCGVGVNYLHVCSNAADAGDQDAPVARQGLLSVLRGDESTFLHDYECSLPTEADRWYSMQVSPVGGGGAVVSHRDITHDREVLEALAQAVWFDQLTGLPNRQTLAEHLAGRLLHPRRNGTRTGLLFIDISRFRIVNAGLGHEVGNEVLRQLAERLGDAAGHDDYLGRVGGDVFAVLADRSDRSQFLHLAHRLRSQVGQPLSVGSRRLELSANVGIALASEQCDAESVLAAADAAVHRAKHVRTGRAVFEDVGDDTSGSTLDAELELRAAIGSQLVLDFQGVQDGLSSSTEWFEALVRWNHPRRGRIGPGSFAPLAEDTGLIVPLGVWVLETAVATAATWPADKSVAVNLSPVQLARSDLVEVVDRTLDRHGFDPHRLILEVTEHSLVDEEPEQIEALDRLRTLGVRIAIDDFGTGYSSFSYLRRLPVDILKIDKAFIDDLPGDGEPVVGAIVGLADALGLDVVAEGVESREQHEVLVGIGCRHIQGFFVHEPMPHDELQRRGWL